MQLFDLSLVHKNQSAPFDTLPPATMPYGSFSKGTALDWKGRRYLVNEVVQAFVPAGTNLVCRTALILSDYVSHGLMQGDFVPWPWFTRFDADGEASQPIYEAIGETLEGAMAAAHDQIRVRPERDFTFSRVFSLGMQFGGFTQQRRYIVQLVEDPDASFRSDGSKPDTKPGQAGDAPE